MALIDEVKTALRISSSNTVFDGEVQGLIDTAKIDLVQAGVLETKVNPDPPDEPDAIIKRAIITYAKANFGYDNPDADRFQLAYVSLKQHLSLYGGYKASVPDET
ncbi:head-tail connector protein [Halalkalibacter sp. APA_J-10(15)]|uniref:head-tail connector protein n=1 Tax=Halalkalibacter sp. APA_J-10(15) TaxID=2933805 RepID=UPI001FF6EB1C|nr:head-tail connector protein [Halalkalibacter sp. APA_J-10(15)]MCK0471397.1 head-tail connector protein [Halalkalibacter sp. APA_J-10(15)]